MKGLATGLMVLALTVSGCAAPGTNSDGSAPQAEAGAVSQEEASSSGLPETSTPADEPTEDTPEATTGADVSDAPSEDTPAATTGSDASDAPSEDTSAATAEADGPHPVIGDTPDPPVEVEVSETGDDVTYAPGPPPDASMSGTLCNLDREFIGALAAGATGGPNTSDDLRLATVSLTDSLSLWNELTVHYPESTEDVDRAGQILAHWQEAVQAADVGDTDSFDEAVAAAEAEIVQLPSAPSGKGLDCAS